MGSLQPADHMTVALRTTIAPVDILGLAARPAVGLLASVASLAETQQALDLGADILDLKYPTKGARVNGRRRCWRRPCAW